VCAADVNLTRYVLGGRAVAMGKAGQLMAVRSPAWSVSTRSRNDRLTDESETPGGQIMRNLRQAADKHASNIRHETCKLALSHYRPSAAGNQAYQNLLIRTRSHLELTPFKTIRA